MNRPAPSLHPLPWALCLAAAFLSCGLDPDPGDRFALVYGVETYVSQPLNYSADDAVAVAELLKARGYPADRVILRTNAEATKEQLEQDLRYLSTLVREDSLFLFFFSGHGWAALDPEGNSLRECIVLYHPSSLFQGILWDEEFGQLLRLVPARRKVVLLDSCNSGGLIGAFPGVDGVPPDYRGTRVDYLKAARRAFVEYFANPDSGDIPYREAVVIAAAGAAEATFEIEKDLRERPVNHGIFTYYFLQTPEGADRNRDGWVTALETYAYIRDRVQKDFNDYFAKDPAFYDYLFLPRISGGPLDIVLFKAGK